MSQRPQASYPDGSWIMVGDIARFPHPELNVATDGIVTAVSYNSVVIDGSNRIPAADCTLVERLHDLQGRPITGPPVPAEITRALAESEAFIPQGPNEDLACFWCSVWPLPPGQGPTPVDTHADDCLWRQAREWADR